MIREQIAELRRNQGYGGNEKAADTMEKLLAVYEAAQHIDNLRYWTKQSDWKTLTDALNAVQTRRVLPAAQESDKFTRAEVKTAVKNAAYTRPGLPGTENCSTDWHRLKCVETKQCPDCGMSTDEFNAATRVTVGEGQ